MIFRWFRYGLEELKFIKSFNDLKIFYKQKLPFFLMRIAYHYNLIGYSKVPPSLQLEPTNNCNLNCICCGPREKMKREKDFMNFNFFQKIMGERLKSAQQ